MLHLYLYLLDALRVALSIESPLISQDFLKHLYQFAKYFDVIVCHIYHEVFFCTMVFFLFIYGCLHILKVYYILIASCPVL